MNCFEELENELLSNECWNFKKIDYINPLKNRHKLVYSYSDGLNDHIKISMQFAIDRLNECIFDKRRSVEENIWRLIENLKNEKEKLENS